MKVKFFLPFSLLWFLLFGTGCRHKTFVSFSNRNIVYEGRIARTPEAAVFYWPGTSATLYLQGKGSVYALLKDEKGKNYYNLILDNDTPRLLHPDTVKRALLLAANLPGGKHSVEIFKRTEWDQGSTRFFGFLLQGNFKVLPPPERKALKLEFYGNSITAGYAVDDDPGHSHPDSIFTNLYDSYAALTARYFHAHSRYICKSGSGIMISWFPLTMPQLYDRLNPEDSNSRWDFSKYTPDIVVVNLLQNDSWLVKMPKRSGFKKKFGSTPPSGTFIVNAYKNFISTLRERYPKAKIICMLGNMDITRKGSPWPGYVKEAVRQLHDSAVYTLFVPYKNTPGHPSRKEQKILADSLIQKIKGIAGYTSSGVSEIPGGK